MLYFNSRVAFGVLKNRIPNYKCMGSDRNSVSDGQSLSILLHVVPVPTLNVPLDPNPSMTSDSVLAVEPSSCCLLCAVSWWLSVHRYGAAAMRKLNESVIFNQTDIQGEKAQREEQSVSGLAKVTRLFLIWQQHVWLLLRKGCEYC